MISEFFKLAALSQNAVNLCSEQQRTVCFNMCSKGVSLLTSFGLKFSVLRLNHLAKISDQRTYRVELRHYAIFFDVMSNVTVSAGFLGKWRLINAGQGLN